MISTGSMAPALFGYHKRIVCPRCGEIFARGVAFDGSVGDAADEAELTGGGNVASCPNCGQGAINVADVPRNHGDQLLVLKHAFDFRPPERWEVVVFRNPNHPTQAFVKRVAGLPGEKVRIVRGDVYADGQICRKSLETQRAIRIPVFEADHAPIAEADWQPRWLRDTGWQQINDEDDHRFEFTPNNEDESIGVVPDLGGDVSPDPFSWLTYHHRVRSGGRHETSVRVTGLPLEFDWPHPLFGDSVRFEPVPEEPGTGTFTAIGALSEDWERQLRSLSSTAEHAAAISRLARESRFAPITDRYAYNRSPGALANVVGDLMVACRVRLVGEGTFAIEITDGQMPFRLLAETSTGTLSLVHKASGELLRTADLPAALFSSEGALVEMSVMDRQALVAIDGTEPFAPWTYDGSDSKPASAQQMVRIGAKGLAVEIRSLVLYRDVYYTPGKSRNGIDSPYALGPCEFFMLGDNSPVSLDSRSWSDGAVPAKLLLGKPFVVHLPSRPGTLRIGNRKLTVRVPDFDRIRYIH